MGLWTRVFGSKPVEQSATDETLLVLSDIHLGEDIVVNGPERLAEYIRRLNRELVDFVAYHRCQTSPGRRLHLVFNGDLFDFAKVFIKPEPEEAFRIWTQTGGRIPLEQGVPNTPENVVWKLERIMEVHRPLFKELARLLLEGHRITFIDGNHDAEFFFDPVRKALQANLLRLVETVRDREQKKVACDLQAIGRRIAFREWFETSPGRYHIEHGHQHDEYCSFEYQLAPFDWQDAETLATPLAHRAAPYFAEYAAELTAVGVDKTGLSYWVRYAWTRGPRVVWMLTRAYWRMIFDFLPLVGPKRRKTRKRLEERHQRRLRALTDSSPYGYETLVRLDELRATPAEYSRFKMYHGSYFDRFLVGAGVCVGLLPGFFLSWLWAVAWSAGVLLVGFATLILLSRMGAQDLPEDLRRAAARIASITGVRYVVFGHSHQPEVVDLRQEYGVGTYGAVAYYLNSGSWVTREILLGERGRGMTYVELGPQGATLQRWRGIREEPLVLAAAEGVATGSQPIRAED